VAIEHPKKDNFLLGIASFAWIAVSLYLTHAYTGNPDELNLLSVMGLSLLIPMGFFTIKFLDKMTELSFIEISQILCFITGVMMLVGLANNITSLNELTQSQFSVLASLLTGVGIGGIVRSGR